MTKPTVGAVICCYENSGHLAEAVRRIYNCVDAIYILIGTHPWSCPDAENPGKQSFYDTYRDASELFDPEGKITIHSRQWASEKDQRTYGKDLLFRSGIEWCMVVDDDELYNPGQLQRWIETTLGKDETQFVYLAPMHVYWKTRDHILPKCNTSYPIFLRSDPSKTQFTGARMVGVIGGNWASCAHGELACHHLSYVRDDDRIVRKLQRFSHAEEFDTQQFWDYWYNWKDGTEARLNHNSVQPVERLDRPLLEDVGYYPDSALESLLARFNFTVRPELEELSGGEGRLKFLGRLARLVSGIPLLSDQAPTWGDAEWVNPVGLRANPPRMLQVYSGSNLIRGWFDRTDRVGTPYVHLPKWELLLVCQK